MKDSGDGSVLDGGARIPGNPAVARELPAPLREFQCKGCGHMVLVHPDLPPDYTPNICAPCGEASRAKTERVLATLFVGLIQIQEVLKAIAPPTEPVSPGSAPNTDNPE